MQKGIKWEHTHETILTQWKAKCFIQMWLQTASSYYYSRIHNLLSYPVIVLSSVASATLFLSKDPMIKYISGAFSITSGILTAVTRQVRPGELYEQYSQVAKRYSMLIRRIQTCLELPRDMRPPAEVFIDKIGSEMDSMSTTQLYPPAAVIHVFERKFGYLDQLMFGQDIIELLSKDMKNRKKVRQIVGNKHAPSRYLLP